MTALLALSVSARCHVLLWAAANPQGERKVLGSSLSRAHFNCHHGGKLNYPSVDVTRGLTILHHVQSYRVLILANYFAGLFALRLIPYVGPIVSFFYGAARYLLVFNSVADTQSFTACIFDSYYCFEAHWEKSGHGLSERVKNLETRWAYHLGFGFPITLICVWS